ncbi:hypothetical protein [Fluoribacter gormanii]|uniref:Uncharacterized protein n=1 Tax=Fluoribacter gormanii TaxID=464 RepID=A0A377GFR8_9GAMM|nr:hypothetical protein [Fluoribacter gormanii]KTD02428.1 hypothetical protein Lgor_1720 [Fluoribacter gormanii]SIR68483.1 hypothetical protein SAMN05421777_11927 [Fluoribacter gormanii]STO23670.1 Uncharacterised protein [Fluoribacter gormanii]
MLSKLLYIRQMHRQASSGIKNAFKLKKAAAIVIGSGVGTGVVLYTLDSEDQKRFKEAEKLYGADKDHLMKNVERQFETTQELLAYAEQLPTGKIPHPAKEAYTPSRSQELVVQGFTGGLLTLFMYPKKHKRLVDACGIALEHHLECITDKGRKYFSDMELTEVALNLPEEQLEERAKMQGKTVIEYTSMLQERHQHAQEGVEACQAFYIDMRHRLSIHKHLAKRYPEARAALEKMLSIDPKELSKITHLSEKECRKILESGIGSAMYGLGLITGQTVAGLNGQIIKDQHLDSIVDIAEKLGTHCMRLIDLAESLKKEGLTRVERAQIIQKIKKEYKNNIDAMRNDELALVKHSCYDREYSQALAHTIAYAQGPGTLFANMNRARIVGGAVPLFPEDLLSLHHQSPHCIHKNHGEGLAIATHKTRELPGMLQRIKITTTQGDQPWLVEPDKGFDGKKAFMNAMDRCYTPCVTMPRPGSSSDDE